MPQAWCCWCYKLACQAACCRKNTVRVTVMIEKILPGIFKIELPLPDISLQTVNTYLLKGKERNLIIDSE